MFVGEEVRFDQLGDRALLSAYVGGVAPVGEREVEHTTGAQHGMDAAKPAKKVRHAVGSLSSDGKVIVRPAEQFGQGRRTRPGIVCLDGIRFLAEASIDWSR